MYWSDSQTRSLATPAFDMQCRTMHPKNIVDEELDWRVLRQTSAAALSASRIVATRWHADNERMLEFGAETTADRHIVKIVLRTMNIRLSVSGRTVQDGLATP